MCSIDDLYEGESNNILFHENTKQEFNNCNKCRTNNPSVILKHKDAYCKECFLVGTTHKFKAQLGKSKLIRPNDKVLVCHKIGHPSTALLHFLRVGIDMNTPKKIRFEPVILFVDDYHYLDFGPRKELLDKIDTEIQFFGFTPHFLSFYDYTHNTERIDHLVFTDVTTMLKSKINFLEGKNKNVSHTYRNDFKIIQLRQLLIDVAKYFECKFVFTPEISVDISAQLLTNVSLGRGCDIPVDTGFCDNRDAVKILRPLRSFDMKELAFYNKFNNLEPIFIEQHVENTSLSVQGLMLKFVKDLQANFPATISTILKIGDKIASNEADKACCRLCKSVIQVGNLQLCSNESTAFSRLVSSETPKYSISRQERYKELLDKFVYNNNTHNLLCYSCSKLDNTEIC